VLTTRPEVPDVKSSDSTASPARNGTNAPPAGPRATRSSAVASSTPATDGASPSRTELVNGESDTPGRTTANMAPPTGTDDAARAAERLKRFASVSQPPSGPSGDRSRNGTPVPAHADVKTEDRAQDNRAVDAASSGRSRTPRPATPPARTGARSGSVESRVSERSRRDRRDDRDRRSSRRDGSRDPDAPRDSARSQTPSERRSINDDTTDRKRQEDLLKAREDNLVTDDRDGRRSSRGARTHETEKEREERKTRERREKKDETGQKRKRDDDVSVSIAP
jgi:THO complex subunit 2